MPAPIIAGLLALLLFSASCVSAPGGPAVPTGEEAPRIVIDGSFSDWSNVPIAVVDPVDPAAVICDFREIRAVSDGAAVFLNIQLQHPLLIRVSGGNIITLVDADGDPTTGWHERGMDGVDLVIVGQTTDKGAYSIGLPVGVRAWSPDADAPSEASGIRTLSAIGVMRAPAFESDLFEVRIPRGLEVPERTDALLMGDTARVKLLATLNDDTVVDEVGPFSIDLMPFQRANAGKRVRGTDPLSRGARTRLRILEWNVSHRTLVNRRDQIKRILSALQPDVLLLNEVTSSIPPDQLSQLLEEAGIQGASKPGHIVYGRRGGDERAVVAGRFPLRALPVLNDLDFPILDAEKLIPEERDPAEIMRHIAEGIQAAGAVVTIGERRIQLTSLGLESGGYRAFEIEEVVRRTQAMTISSAMADIHSTEEFDAVIVAGDFNLVVTEKPLETIGSRSNSEQPILTTINALQLDGLTNSTWINRELSFAAGRLDYMLYSASSLDLDRSFVFDSGDLSADWLEYHGLEHDISTNASDHLPIVADFSW